jgi:hypothetical protein
MTICPHTIRLIEDWAGKKAVNNATKSTVGNSRGAIGFGLDFPAPGEKTLRNRNGNNNTVTKIGVKRRDGI